MEFRVIIPLITTGVRDTILPTTFLMEFQEGTGHPLIPTEVETSTRRVKRNKEIKSGGVFSPCKFKEER